MRPIFLAILTALAITCGIAACVDDAPSTDQTEVEVKGRGIIDCNNSIMNAKCKECGNAGDTVCCDPYYELGCDVLCNTWVYNKDRTARWCQL